ncbi:MAG: complex I NDUFA9 subunit family protein, partial [Mesorhizobium sp.]
SPVLPLIGGGQTKFQPVYVGDVAEAVARSVDGKVQGGRIYELGGPQVLTFKQCMQEMLAMIDRKRLLVSVPWWVANMQASILGLLPNPLLTKDQVLQLREHNVVSEAATRENRTLAGLDIQPQSIGSILPSYLWRYRAAGQFQRKTAA